MTTSVHLVDVRYVVNLWPKVESFLEAGLNTGDEVPEDSKCYNMHHVQMFLTSGQWSLYVVLSDTKDIIGAVAVSFANYPLHRVAFITLIGGKAISSKDSFAQFTELLRQQGVTKIQGFGRPSIVRLWRRLGFEPRTTMVEVSI